MSMSYPARTAFFCSLDFGFVQIGDFSLDRLDGLDLIYRLDVQADNQIGFHVQKLRQHSVIQFRREDLYEADRPVLFPHSELLAGAEFKPRRRDEVLGGQATGREPIPLKAERQLLIHVEDTVELGKSCLTIQSLGSHAQTLEVIENVGLNTLQTGFGRFDAVRVNAEGEILGFDKAVVALRQLVLQHSHVLHPNTVKIIPLERNGNGTGKSLFGCCKIQKRQLKFD